jgi:hypothetical protein
MGKELLSSEDLSRKFSAVFITYKLYGPKKIGLCSIFLKVFSTSLLWDLRHFQLSLTQLNLNKLCDRICIYFSRSLAILALNLAKFNASFVRLD